MTVSPHQPPNIDRKKRNYFRHRVQCTEVHDDQLELELDFMNHQIDDDDPVNTPTTQTSTNKEVENGDFRCLLSHSLCEIPSPNNDNSRHIHLHSTLPSYHVS